MIPRFEKMYAAFCKARRVEEIEREFVSSGRAFFYVSGEGHDATAVLADRLGPADFLHCHYRDKALMIARGVAPVSFLHGSLCDETVNSQGRQMSAHLADPARNVLSIVGPVGNQALQAVGVAAEIKNRPEKPIVVCSLGDGTCQEGEVLEAVAEAVRWTLPVLFLIADNRYSISTGTRGRTFWSLPSGDTAEFHGLQIHRLNGRDVLACDAAFHHIVNEMRKSREPALAIMDVERLGDHTNADDQTIYRRVEEIAQATKNGDPVANFRRQLLGSGVSEGELVEIEEQANVEVQSAAEATLAAPQPTAIFTAKADLLASLVHAEEFCGSEGGDRLTMAEAIRDTLRARLAADSRVTLYGEDIEDPKGDVFGVTRGLSTAFPGRVKNSPVTESTIVGTSIGRALAGGRPVAFIQFADFMPLAFNQIAMELGSMYWRTNGGWQCPVIVMIACGGYRPGLGPFHSHTLESIACHVPGIDVAMPSSAADAAGILNAAFQSNRPTLFFYPKTCLNDREHTTSADVDRQLVPVGKSRILRSGQDITLVCWGSTTSLCEKAAAALAQVGCSVDVIDLRWLSPWDEEAVCQSAKATGKLIVVHEDNRTTGFGAEVVATVAERVGGVVCRRVTRADTYVPCHFGNQLEVLPSFKSILTAAAEMLEFDLRWEVPASEDSTVFVVNAIGSSPADEMVTVAEMNVAVGKAIKAGDTLANLECDKAMFDFSSPVTGIVEEICVPVGQQVRVGMPLVKIRVPSGTRQHRQPVREESGTPILTRKQSVQAPRVPSAANAAQSVVGLSAVYAVTGAATTTNHDLAARFPNSTEESIYARTGIRIRPRATEEQTAVQMAVDAAGKALLGEGLSLKDIDLIVCSTSTPPMVSPSLACLVLHELSKRFGDKEIPAFDVMAACTGYLYALGSAWDYLQTRPNARVLVLTSEVMSKVVNPEDFDTAVLFGDAASATIVSGSSHLAGAKMRLHRPLLAARGEPGEVLHVPHGGNGDFVKMDGKKVFSEAVRRMTTMLERACSEIGWKVEDLDLIVPHQANGRIIEAIQTRLRRSAGLVRNDVAEHGNTSSSTIPLALAKVRRTTADQKIGICAFGAGLTFGAAVLELPPERTIVV